MAGGSVRPLRGVRPAARRPTAWSQDPLTDPVEPRPAEIQQETSGAAVTGPERPPSVCDEIWAAVPAHLREEVLDRAAADLRRCIHPEDSILRSLGEHGISVKRGRRPVTRQPADETEAVPGPTPSTPLGIALHRAMGLIGKPGRRAADAEREVLAAVRKDPAFAMSCPGDLALLGVRIPGKILESVADLVRQQAERIIEELRIRKSEGDPEAAAWADPDDWSFHTEDPARFAP